MLVVFTKDVSEKLSIQTVVRDPDLARHRVFYCKKGNLKIIDEWLGLVFGSGLDSGRLWGSFWKSGAVGGGLKVECCGL